MEMNEIGTRIKNRRLQLGYTQEELAKLLGYKSQVAVSRIESGQRAFPMNKVNSFAKALDVTPSYIMGYENDKTLQMMINQDSDTPQNRLCEKCRKLYDSECAQVSDYVDYIVSKR